MRAILPGELIVADPDGQLRSRRFAPSLVAARLQLASWEDYVERFEVTSRAAFQDEAARAGQALVAELYGRYLERAKTVAWWSEPVAP